MTAGTEAIDTELHRQFGVQEVRIGVGTMDLGVAIDAVGADGDTGMSAEMSRWRAMTLPAKAITRLAQQPVIRRSMRIVALNTIAALDQMRIGYRMLEPEWSRLFAMAILAGPVMPDGEHRIGIRSQTMAVGAADVLFQQRMRRARLKLCRHRAMAGVAELLSFINHQADRLTMHTVATGATDTVAAMGIACQHRLLVRRRMTLRAEQRLFSLKQVARIGDRLDRGIIEMLLPAGVAADTAYHDAGAGTCRQLVDGAMQLLIHTFMAIEAGLAGLDHLGRSQSSKQPGRQHQAAPTEKKEYPEKPATKRQTPILWFF